MNKVRKIIDIIREIANTPGIDLSLYGEFGFEFYKYFTKRHNKLIFIPNKKYLIALLHMPEDFNQYVSACKDIQYDVKKAVKRGYRFSSFVAAEYINDMYEIHMSSGTRQNKSMSDSYTDIDKVRAFCAGKSRFWGVFDANNKLCAYAYSPIIGDVILINRILGHQDAMKDGVMYLLVREIVSQFYEDPACRNKWFMYDSFLGSSAGLRRFKLKLGFNPYNVRWDFRSDIS